MKPVPPSRLPRSRGFTVVEILVATTILAFLLVFTLQIVNQSSRIWRHASDKMESFQGARNSFGLLTRNLGQATLNAYLDYDSATAPKYYIRKSDLAFYIGPAGTGSNPGTAGSGQCVFFQFPGGYTATSTYASLDALLNGCGYFVSFSREPGIPSYIPLSKAPYRYRLMQYLVPTEQNKIYSYAALGKANGWFTDTGVGATPTPVADNVIALVIRPQDPASTPPDLAPNYLYDSTVGATYPQVVTSNQLPPVLLVTLIAISESSAKRLDTGTSTPPALITSILHGHFQSASSYDADLAAVEAGLNNAHIDYEVFVGAVPLRESKWTK
ncbi:Verru_Chthon cassette protein C [Verrucomicrobium sp. GAS474]|nr:Verru_Chthon cassette protein C [Verrucomicrobium sp. GAS474]